MHSLLWAHGRVPRLLSARLLGNASINGNVAVAFGVAVALFVLLALLGVTSLGIVKRA